MPKTGRQAGEMPQTFILHRSHLSCGFGNYCKHHKSRAQEQVSEKLDLTALIEPEVPFTENDLAELKIHNWRLVVVKTIHYGLSEILQETNPLQAL